MRRVRTNKKRRNLRLMQDRKPDKEINIKLNAVINEIKELETRIETLEKINPFDPRIAELMEEVDKLQYPIKTVEEETKDTSKEIKEKRKEIRRIAKVTDDTELNEEYITDSIAEAAYLEEIRERNRKEEDIGFIVYKDKEEAQKVANISRISQRCLVYAMNGSPVDLIIEPEDYLTIQTREAAKKNENERIDNLDIPLSKLDLIKKRMQEKMKEEKMKEEGK